MSVQRRLDMTHIIAGTLATSALLVQAPQASAGIATASIVAMNHDAASPTEAVGHAIAKPCEHPEQGTILSDATASLAALGSDSPLAQASVLIAGLGCLASGSLLLKRNGQ